MPKTTPQLNLLNTPGMHQDAPPRIFQFAEKNRCKLTPTEALLWNALKNKQLGGYKFRRQHPISRFIVDFYCHSKRLAIELDGGYHNNPDQKAYDAYRTGELTSAGIREIRFQNEAVWEDFWGVLERIWEELDGLPAPKKEKEYPCR